MTWGDQVTDHNGATPSRTAVALQHLGQAIDRLEAAAAHDGAGNLLLASQLNDARDRVRQLEHVNRDISQRLDGAIHRLRQLLEEE